MANDNLQQSELMIRAAESGQAGIRQAHAGLMNQYQVGSQQATQQAQATGQVVGQELDRAQQESQFARNLDQRKSETELEARKAGIEPNSRQAKLDQEMQKGQGQPKIGPLQDKEQENLRQQASKPMEMDGQGRWRTSEATADLQEREMRVKERAAATERLRVMTYKDSIGLQAQRAHARGDMKEYEANVEKLAVDPNNQQKSFDRFNKAEADDKDWADLEKMAWVGRDTEQTLMNDIKARNFTPRVSEFLKSQIATNSLIAIALGKGNDSKLRIDWMNPKMREFRTEAENLNDFIASTPALGEMSFVDSTDGKMSFVYTVTAINVLQKAGISTTQGQPTMANPQQQPSAAGPAAPSAAPIQQTQGTARPGMPGPGAGAASAMVGAGGSPNEALRAGQNVDPTARGPASERRPDLHQQPPWMKWGMK